MALVFVIGAVWGGTVVGAYCNYKADKERDRKENLKLTHEFVDKAAASYAEAAKRAPRADLGRLEGEFMKHVDGIMEPFNFNSSDTENVRLSANTKFSTAVFHALHGKK